MVNSQERDPTNFTLAQWQQAKRIGKDPKAIKQAFQDCWTMSDNRSSFEAALKSRGYYLAKGDRRGFVALDCRCEVFAVAKWVGVKTKDIRAKLGEEKELPSVEATRTRIASEMKERLTSLTADHNEVIARRKAEIEKKRKAMMEARRTIGQRQKRLEQFTQYQQQDLSRDIQQFNEIAKQQREYFERLDNSRSRYAYSRDGPGLEL